MEDNIVRNEKTGEAILHMAWLLLLAIVFMIASIVISSRASKYHLSRSTLHDYDKNADLGLVTISSTRATSNAGNGYEIPQSVAVDRNYFSDALFVGDSITSGLNIYDMFESSLRLDPANL